MKNRVTLWLLVGLVAATSLAVAGKGLVLGDGVGDAHIVPIAKLLAEPETYVDQRVKVKGAVTDVCPKAGCWIDIAKGNNSIRFKVNDGEIVFTTDMRGEKVVAEGILKRMELTQEQAVGYAQHMAEEKGESFDPESVKGPMTIYRIQGTGAVVR